MKINHHHQWDCGGGDKIRPLFKHYFENTDAMIMVVDSTDHQRLPEFKNDFLMQMLSDDRVRDCPVLIFANKQDLPGALGVAELIDRLSLSDLKQNWHVQPCCTTSGMGLYEGLDWVSHQLE